jgi:uncharacterized membrane protein
LSIRHFNVYSSSMFDLGNMAQSIASVRRGEPLVFTYSSGQMSRLSLHVEWIYFLLAIPYAFWPDPRLLIVLQAAFFAAGAVPVYRLAWRHTESLFAARCMALIYLLYPVAQTAVLRDIHGDTLAMPLLLFAIDALDRRGWSAYWFWLALALSCKVYVAIPISLLGILIWFDYRERLVALATTGIGIVYGSLTFLIVRPLFTTSTTSEAHRGWNYISFYFGEIGTLLSSLDWRAANALIVFGPVLILAWRAWRWLIPGIPIALAALLSTRGGSAGYASHHYALVVPFIISATLFGMIRLRRSAQASTPPEVSTAAPTAQRRRSGIRNWKGDLGFTLVVVILFNLALVDTPFSPTFWMGLPGKGLDQIRFGWNSRDGMKDGFLAEHVPPSESIAVSLFLAPHLTDREVLYLVRYEVGQGERRLPKILPEVNFVLADALFDFRQLLPTGGFEGGIATEVREIRQVLSNPNFDLVAMRDGLLLFERNAPAERILEQQVEIHSGTDTIPQAQFGAQIDLVEAPYQTTGRTAFPGDVCLATCRRYAAGGRSRGRQPPRQRYSRPYRTPSNLHTASDQSLATGPDHSRNL